MMTGTTTLQRFEQLKTLLFNVVKTNTDTMLYGFHIDPPNSTALAGHRLSSQIGDLLFRIQWQGQLTDSNVWVPSMYNYIDQELVEYEGLPRPENPDGGRDVCGTGEAEELFNTAFSEEKVVYRLRLNPRSITEFIEKRVNDNMENKKINMQAFDGINAYGHFPGQVVSGPQGEPQIAVRTKRGIVYAAVDDRHSVIAPHRLKDGHLYIIDRVGVVEGTIIVRVLREFEIGVRFAIQEIKSGIKRVGEDNYSVLEEADNSIRRYDIEDYPFIEGQDELGNFANAPAMTFDLSQLYSAMKTMEMYKSVVMIYQDSFTPAVIYSENEENEPFMDCLIGPTNPYVNGKVCLL